jgi:hypothetical protein
LPSELSTGSLYNITGRRLRHVFTPVIIAALEGGFVDARPQPVRF